MITISKRPKVSQIINPSMSVINNESEVVFSEGKYKGKSIGEVGASYIGYGYLMYMSSQGDENVRKYLEQHPERPAVTWQECKEFVLPFGKHKGKTLIELARCYEGRSYLRYLSGWENMNERKLVQKLVANFGKMVDPMLNTDDWQKWEMPFGKYKGQTMLEVWRTNPGYVRYMSKQMKQKPNDQNKFLGARLEYVMSNLQ